MNTMEVVLEVRKCRCCASEFKAMVGSSGKYCSRFCADKGPKRWHENKNEKPKREKVSVDTTIKVQSADVKKPTGLSFTTYYPMNRRRRRELNARESEYGYTTSKANTG